MISVLAANAAGGRLAQSVGKRAARTTTRWFVAAKLETATQGTIRGLTNHGLDQLLGLNISPADRELMRETVVRRRPDSLPFLDRLGIDPLQESVREEIREAIVSELSATGLDGHDEPTRRGLRLEHLIDVLGRS